MDEIKEKIIKILKQHKVTKAGIFGSFSDGTQNENSDIDILVELEENVSLLDFIDIKYELEDSLNKKVDLVEYDSIKPLLKSEILRNELRII